MIIPKIKSILRDKSNIKFLNRKYVFCFSVHVSSRYEKLVVFHMAQRNSNVTKGTEAKRLPNLDFTREF